MDNLKRVLIIGEKYSSNLGDGVIFDEVFYLLKENFVITSVDLSGRQKLENKKDLHNFNIFKEKIRYFKKKMRGILYYLGISKISITKNNFKSIFDNCINTFKPNVILFCGGQIFLDCFLKNIIYVVECSEKNNINVYFNSCGCGKITGYNKIILDKIINNDCVKYISVRDGFNYIKKYDKNLKIKETFDTALLCNNIYKQSKKSEKVGLGIMLSHNTNISKQIIFWKKIIKEFKKDNIDWEVFCNGNPIDYAFCKYILKITNEDIKRLHKRPTSQQELVSTITNYNKIISMRLHSLIIAYSFDIPAVAISWDQKVEEFYKKILMSNLCFNLRVNPKKIFKEFKNIDYKALFKNREVITNNIKTNIQNIINLINKN